MSKVLIWLASGDEDKIKPGIIYGTNAKKYKWVDDVKFVVFGDSERLLLEREDLFDSLPNDMTVFCKFVSDSLNISKELEKKGAKVIYVGEYISKLIKDGYQVLVF